MLCWPLESSCVASRCPGRCTHREMHRAHHSLPALTRRKWPSGACTAPHSPMEAVRPEVSSATISGAARGSSSALLASITAYSANPLCTMDATGWPTTSSACRVKGERDRRGHEEQLAPSTAQQGTLLCTTRCPLPCPALLMSLPARTGFEIRRKGSAAHLPPLAPRLPPAPPPQSRSQREGWPAPPVGCGGTCSSSSSGSGWVSVSAGGWVWEGACVGGERWPHRAVRRVEHGSSQLCVPQQTKLASFFLQPAPLAHVCVSSPPLMPPPPPLPRVTPSPLLPSLPSPSPLSARSPPLLLSGLR